MLQEKIEQTLNKLQAACLQVYGDQLVSLVVFGSVGRGTPRFNSDIDLLVVAYNFPRGRLQRVRGFEAVERELGDWLNSLRSLDIELRLSPLFKTPEEVKQGSLIFLDMVYDARLLFDREAFFECYLERLRARLDELGAYRVWEGSRWHWVLKPDYTPGEVFEV